MRIIVIKVEMTVSVSAEAFEVEKGLKEGIPFQAIYFALGSCQ